MNKLKTDKGFTIVELLIVIVVIAILAAITIVAYNGIQARSKTSAAQSAAVNVDKKAEAFNIENSRYPLTTAELQTPTTASWYVTGVTFGTPTSTAAPNTVSFLKCGSGTPTTQTLITSANITGVRIGYYDYSAPGIVTMTAGSDTGTGIACPTAP